MKSTEASGSDDHQSVARESTALIMRGGGAKGIALLGAVKELARFYDFSCFIGASAGAITAALLAAGFSVDELEREVRAKNFADFFDASWPRALMNLVFRGGLYQAETLRTWLEQLVTQKSDHLPVRVSQLATPVVIYAAKARWGTLKYETNGLKSSTDVVSAVRNSMSIPYVFTPGWDDDGNRVYDGGLLHNFPVEDYVRNHPGEPFVALYLGAKRYPERGQSSIAAELLDVWLSQDEPQILDRFAAETVVIDPDPISTLDFSLGIRGKDYLLLKGRIAGLKYLVTKGKATHDDGLLLPQLETEAANERDALIQLKESRLKVRMRYFVVLAIALVGSLGFMAGRISALARGAEAHARDAESRGAAGTRESTGAASNTQAASSSKTGEGAAVATLAEGVGSAQPAASSVVKPAVSLLPCLESLTRLRTASLDRGITLATLKAHVTEHARNCTDVLEKLSADDE